MATMAEVAEPETAPVIGETSSPRKSPDVQKRKVSDADSEHQDDEPAKRLKIESPSSRRQRDEDDHTHDAGSPPPGRRNSNQDAGASRSRPAPSKDEEKKRGKRLFGGLLSTLSQTPAASSQHKRRREIEQRQHERAEKQKVQDEKRVAERRAQITQVRRREQINFDERAMKTRHANLLARAHSLQTKSQPRIYYRPWKLSRQQEDSIDDQIADAKATIAREVDNFELHREQHERRYGKSRSNASTADAKREPAERKVSSGSGSTSKPEPGPEPIPRPRERPDEPTAEDAAANSDPAELSHGGKSGSGVQLDQAQAQHDESGDVVVHNEEDMVMY